ncbi:MAG: response regulator [Desulfovibrio sp.]|nr:response regulator [Desulfovibrio sp.]
MTQALPLAPVLLLNATQSNATVDKQVLREAGVMHIETMTSGVEAARHLAEKTDGARDCIVVCNQRLSDMSGEQFCDIVRLHPRLLSLPILLVAPSDDDRDHLLALAAGASAVIARPYSVQTMRDTLEKLTESSRVPPHFAKGADLIRKEQFDECLLHFSEVVRPAKHPPEDYFKVGMQCLLKQKWNSAITAFHRALTSQIYKGEAELGIAMAFRGKGDAKNAAIWMKRATDTFITAGRWHLARIIFARLEKSGQKTRNPFLAKARQQISEGAYRDAATTLVEGLPTVPHNVVAERMADLCAHADSPKDMLDSLLEALEKRSVDYDEISASIDKELKSKILEQQERLQRAKDERTDQLSKRITSMRQKEAEQAKEDQVRQATPWNAADGANGMLSPLPGDRGLNAVPPPQSLPPFSGEETVSFPRIPLIFTIVRATWHLARRIRF